MTGRGPRTGIARGAEPALRLLAGPVAARLIAERGLRAEDVAAVPAAAGGPKGLALLPLDRWLFGHWLPSAPRPRMLAGASIGAWRMAAAARRDPLAALDRLEHAYLETQRYPRNPSPATVSAVCRAMAREVIGDAPASAMVDLAPGARLLVITARARAPVPDRATAFFARAALANGLARERLAALLERVVFDSAADQPCAVPPTDAFGARRLALRADNLEDALLASGSIPRVADPVRDIAGAPAGAYWDGGLIDYHLHWDWRPLEGIVLMPHFVPHVTAGWLDKFLPWRRHGLGEAGGGWLDRLVLAVPSPALLASLPGGRLPERQDFHRYGLDHDRRLRDWRRAIAQCEAMAEDFAEAVAHPGRITIEPLAAGAG
jgi:hypothetical protein